MKVEHEGAVGRGRDWGLWGGNGEGERKRG